MAAALTALAGRNVHVVTVNDYLAQRDAELGEPLFTRLGFTQTVAGEVFDRGSTLV